LLEKYLKTKYLGLAGLNQHLPIILLSYCVLGSDIGNVVDP